MDDDFTIDADPGNPVGTDDTIQDDVQPVSSSSGVMNFLKKYWWVIAGVIIVVVVMLFMKNSSGSSSSSGAATPVSSNGNARRSRGSNSGNVPSNLYFLPSPTSSGISASTANPIATPSTSTNTSTTSATAPPSTSANTSTASAVATAKPSAPVSVDVIPPTPKTTANPVANTSTASAVSTKPLSASASKVVAPVQQLHAIQSYQNAVGTTATQQTTAAQSYIPTTSAQVHQANANSYLQNAVGTSAAQTSYASQVDSRIAAGKPIYYNHVPYANWQAVHAAIAAKQASQTAANSITRVPKGTTVTNKTPFVVQNLRSQGVWI